MSRIGIIYTITMYEKTRSTPHKLIQNYQTIKIRLILVYSILSIKFLVNLFFIIKIVVLIMD